MQVFPTAPSPTVTHFTPSIFVEVKRKREGHEEDNAETQTSLPPKEKRNKIKKRKS